jgi:outer membrane receptor protein involved in Fe transport
MSIRAQTVRSLLVGAAALAVATPAWAQTEQEQQAQAANQATEAEQGDVIIVTATKRASTVQDVPFSINAQTQEDIQRANASTIEDISRNVAGLAVQNLGPGQSQVSVRGVSAGQIVRDQPGVKEQVGVYLDESVISLSLFTPDLDLFDLNRVETLRGPQGTLFGSGSVGGTVRYITNQPRLGRTEGMVEANLNHVADGDFGGHLKGAVNVPLGETAALRAVGYYTKYAGFIDAFGSAGEYNINDGERYGGRIALLWQPVEELKITPRVVYQKVKSDGFNRQEIFNLFANELSTSRPQVEFDEREQYLLLKEKFKDDTLLADLTASYGFGAVELTSVTSYIDREILVSRDASALTGSISDDGVDLPDEAVMLPSNLLDTTDLKTFTQELRLSSTGSGPLQWLVGVFYSDVDRDYSQTLPTPGYADAVGIPTGGTADPDSPYNSFLTYDIKQKAVFGEATYDFGQIKLTAGGRYYDFKEDRHLQNQGIFAGSNSLDQVTKSNGFSPRAILTYEPNRNLSVNLQVAKGFRLGGANDPINIPICSDEDLDIFGPFSGTSYEDETLWNYEAGIKYSKGPITFNGAIFHTKIKDLQVTLDAGSCSSRLVFNVDKAHTTGVEMEFAASPIEGLDLSIAGSYVSAEFDTTLPGTLPETTGIREGNRLPSVPKLQLAASATYSQRFRDNAEWFVTASVQHVGSRYTQPSDQENNPRTFIYRPVVQVTDFDPDFGEIPVGAGTTVDLKLPSYNLVNLSTGVEFDSGLGVTVYANNLFDENAKLSFDRERGGRARLGFNIGTPRTIGITVRQKFGN